MTDIDRRLRELRQATDGQLRPPAELLARIEASVEPRPRWRLPVMVAAVAALVAALVAVTSIQAGRPDQRVAARPPTKAEFVWAMNAGCQEYVLETEAVQVVFPTPEAYALVAENRMSALVHSLDRIRAIGAPRHSDRLVEQVTAEATTAQVATQAALDAARMGQTAPAAAALGEVDAAVNRVGGLLAAYGATSCRPPAGP